MGQTIFQLFLKVNGSNCLIKKVLEMGIVASNKKVLDINETLPPVAGHKEVGMRLTMQQRQAVVAKAASRYPDVSQPAQLISLLVQPFPNTS